MQAIREKFGDDMIHRALSECQQALVDGRLIPTDAYDIAYYVATVGSMPEDAPRGPVEQQMFEAAVRIVPIYEV